MANSKTLTLIGLAATLVFSGCSSKQYFEPDTTYSVSGATRSFDGNIVDLSRDGATLDNGYYIGQNGVTPITLGKGYRFLSESSQYVLATNKLGTMKIIDKGTKQAVRNVEMAMPVISAAISGDKVAYILNDNTFGIYRVQSGKKVMESRSGQTFAIDTRAASPMFIDSLAVFPMLDGKLIIVNAADVANARVVYISAEDAFNNVIYLDRTGNTMVAATPRNLITLGGEGRSEHMANISEAAVSGGTVYLFTKEGDILKLNTALETLSKTKFKFAHFSLATAFGGKVYAVDQKGSLIVLNSELDRHKIYDIGAIDKPAFIAGTKLYKDGDIIELSKLGYE
jgi:hypothetical protein